MTRGAHRKRDPHVGSSEAVIERQLSPFARALWPPHGIAPLDLDAELARRNQLRPPAGSTLAPLPRTPSRPPPRRTSAWSSWSEK